MADEQHDNDNVRHPALQSRSAEIVLEEASPGEPEKWSLDEAIAWLDNQSFETEGDSTAIVRQMRDAR
jgi:hypothetical protein